MGRQISRPIFWASWMRKLLLAARNFVRLERESLLHRQYANKLFLRMNVNIFSACSSWGYGLNKTWARLSNSRLQLKRKSHSRIKILRRISLYLCFLSLFVFCIILYKQFNFRLAPQTFGLVTSSNSLPEEQPHVFIFVSPCYDNHFRNDSFSLCVFGSLWRWAKREPAWQTQSAFCSWQDFAKV